jgi:2',3'-cyclic-nucleotide 2'-phosphodiesterase (5'-nucleotidase family)
MGQLCSTGPPNVDVTHEETSNPLVGAKLRIISVNDVYVLDNFARLKTMIKEESTSNVVTMLPGDFLAPSLLSSLDRGKAMVEMLNLVGIDIVCFGNHESDVPYSSLQRRIAEFHGIWLNSNMPGFQPELPESHVIVVGQGENARTVGLLGFLIGGGEHKTLYREDAMGGHAKGIIPPLEAAQGSVDRLRNDHPGLGNACIQEWQRTRCFHTLACSPLRCCVCPADTIVALTHQGMAEDLQLAETGLFSVLVAGHDHHLVMERASNGCPVVKAGADAFHAAVIDLEWSGDRTEKAPTGTSNAQHCPCMQQHHCADSSFHAAAPLL